MNHLELFTQDELNNLIIDLDLVNLLDLDFIWNNNIPARIKNSGAEFYNSSTWRFVIRRNVVERGSSHKSNIHHCTYRSICSFNSIVESDIRNILYNWLLLLDMPEEVFLVDNADDVTSIIIARNAKTFKCDSIRSGVRSSWIELYRLELATNKTEMVLLSRNRTICDFTVRSANITSKSSMKYLWQQAVV